MEEAWGGRYCVPDLSALPAGLDYSLQEFVGISLLLFFFLLLIFRKSLPAFFRLFYSSLLYKADIQKIDHRLQFRVFRSLLVVFLSFLLLAVLYHFQIISTDFSSPGWWRPLLMVVGGTFAYFLVRRILSDLLGLATGYRDLFQDVAGITYPFFSLMVVWLVLSTCFSDVRWLVATGMIVLYVLYLGYLMKVFLAGRVPFFLTILYLCTLEFLAPALWIGTSVKLLDL